MMFRCRKGKKVAEGFGEHPSVPLCNMRQAETCLISRLDSFPNPLYTRPMLARVYSCAVIGLDGVIVEVEVDTGEGLPSMVIVGWPDVAVQESRELAQAAFKNAGLYFPLNELQSTWRRPRSVKKAWPTTCPLPRTCWRWTV